MNKKILSTGIILLFIGLAIAPSINANITKDNEMVEFTTEVCGIDGGRQTVQLSKEAAEEVEQLFGDIERRLDIVETREETIEIFNNAIVELNKYNLLGGLNLNQAQKLVSGHYQDKLFNKINSMKQFGIFDDFFNVLCLLSAKVTYQEPYYLDPIILAFGLLFMAGIAPAWIISGLGFENLASFVLILAILISYANPFRLMNLILFLSCDFDIVSIGLKGVVSSDDIELGGFFGFTGLMFNAFGEETYFLGFTLLVA